MGQAPKCQRFPSCGKRHYGDCDSGATGERPDGSSRKPKKAASLKKRLKAAPKPADQTEEFADVHGHVIPFEEHVLARLESLEARVGELESRKKYMREYQARKRAEARERGDG